MKTEQMLQRVIVELDISADCFVTFYQGRTREVVATASNGEIVRFPANILRPFVSTTGIKGRFEICFTRDNRFHSINELN